MNHLLNLTRKELKELLTPGTIVSILAVVILLSLVGNAMSGNEESVSSPKQMGIVYEGSPDDVILSYGEQDMTLEGLITSTYKSTYDVDDPSEYVHYMTAGYGDAKAITEEMEEQDYAFAISIPGSLKTNLANEIKTTISSYYSYSNGGLFSTVTTASGTTFISNMGTIISYLLTYDSEGEATAKFLSAPLSSNSCTEVNGKVYEDLTPAQIYNAMLGQSMLVPIIVMIVIVMVGSIVISSMGSEKENKTLETLLTMPIKRTTIVSGKLLAAAIMGLVYGICYLAGMMFYSNGLTAGLGSNVDLKDYGLSMEPLDWLVLMVVLFLAIFCALGICMILGAFTKNYKMAQTMTMPISGLAIIPMFVFMFTSWENLPVLGQIAMFIIPFSHPMMAMDNLMFGDMSLVVAGIAYLVIIDAVLILITVKIYNSDILITGLGGSKSMKKIKKLFNVKEKEHEDN